MATKLPQADAISAVMARTQIVMTLLAALTLASCSSSPDEPVNQTAPIRTMDNFFRSLSPSSPPPVYAQQPVYAPAYERRSGYAPAYAHEPGYAPAYPPLDP